MRGNEVKLTIVRYALMAVAAAIGHRVRDGATRGRVVISSLKRSLRTGRHQTSYHELAGLAGCWTREEADAFDLALREQRMIDPKAWGWPL
jgi:hypothetical protein